MPRSRRLSWRCRTRSTSCRGPAPVRGLSGRPGPVRPGARIGALLFSLLWVIALSSPAAASRPDAGIATGQIEDGPDGENEKATPPAGEPVDAGRGQARFEAALRLFTAGKQPDAASAAAAALEQLARELPADEIAPEALFEAAQLNDEQLGRPDQAERLYEALLRGYPSSRLVRRAESRLGQLREGLRTGTDALIRFQRIIRATSEGSAERIAQLSALWEAVGAKVELMEAAHHDRVLAVTSHLPHLIAYTIVGTASDLEEVTQSEVIKYSAGGFRDFTRIAASDPTMWRDVFLANKDAVLEMLQRFSEDLTSLQRAIRWGDGDTLFELFSRTRAIRRGIIEQGQDDARPDFGRSDHTG